MKKLLVACMVLIASAAVAEAQSYPGQLVIPDGTGLNEHIVGPTDADLAIVSTNSKNLLLGCGSTKFVKLDSNGNLQLNITGSNLAQGATNGYLYLPMCATGAPNGTPASLPSGEVPVMFGGDHVPYAYYSGAWNSMSAPTGSAGGDLGGSYPNPTVTSVADVTAGTLGAGYGGTGQSSYTSGDILYATGSTALSKLGIGSPHQLLAVVSSAPAWVTSCSIVAGSNITVTNGVGTITIASTGGGGGTTYPVAPNGGSYSVTASGSHSSALGDTTTLGSTTGSTGLGYGITITGNNDTVTGYNSNTNPGGGGSGGSNSIFGEGSTISGSGCANVAALGQGISVQDRSVAIGAGTLGSTDGVYIGYQVTNGSSGAANPQATVIGYQAHCSVSGIIQVGYQSHATNGDVNIGNQGTTSGQFTYLISSGGGSLACTGDIGIGYDVTDTSGGSYCILIGRQANTAVACNYSIGLGYHANPTADHQFVAGCSSSGSAFNDGHISDVYFGSGVTDTTASAYTIHGTGGSGSNNAAADLTAAGGISTGNATPGKLWLSTSTATTSGSTAQTLTHRVEIDGKGNVVLNASGSNLAQNATDGFAYVPVCSTGAPSGNPTSFTGAAPFVVNGTNLYFYSSGSWQQLAGGTLTLSGVLANGNTSGAHDINMSGASAKVYFTGGSYTASAPEVLGDTTSDLYLMASPDGSTNVGHASHLVGAAGGAANKDGGDADLTGGDGVSSTGKAGNVNIAGGQNFNSSTFGNVNVTGGIANGSATQGGSVNVTGGGVTGSNLNGGKVNVSSGLGTGYGSGSDSDPEGAGIYLKVTPPNFTSSSSNWSTDASTLNFLPINHDYNNSVVPSGRVMLDWETKWSDGGNASNCPLIGFYAKHDMEYTNPASGGSFTAEEIAVVQSGNPTGPNYFVRYLGGSAGTTDLLSIGSNGTVATYGGTSTAGMGVAPTYASGTFAAQSSLQSSIATFTPGANGTFSVKVWMNIVTTGSASLNVQVTYHDENGASQTQTVPLTNSSGTTSAGAVSAQDTYYGTAVLRCDNQAITVKTVGTAATSYDGGAYIEQGQ